MTCGESENCMSQDISKILKKWKFGGNTDFVVRKICGVDGRPKIQMRVELGLFQMETEGRPDGLKPNGFNSYLEYYGSLEEKLMEVDGLSAEDYRLLMQEGIQYYYRYLCLMKLGEYDGVIRDTERNLRLFSFVRRTAKDHADIWVFDQYRPYVIMMRSQAKALLFSKKVRIHEALDCLQGDIEEIRRFYREYSLDSEAEQSVEISMIERLKEHIEQLLPPTLEEQLKLAVAQERYEDAARLRDLIQKRRKVREQFL